MQGQEQKDLDAQGMSRRNLFIVFLITERNLYHYTNTLEKTDSYKSKHESAFSLL